MSKLLKEVRNLVPPLLEKFHKGQLGRVLVVGGSEDYTGAPYFASMASALVGADMSHILCSHLAGTVIKGYSPNLMVHPYLKEDDDHDGAFQGLDAKTESLLDRIHVVLLGPGLGRNKLMVSQAEAIIKSARDRNLPLVIDADGLYVIQNNLEIIKGAEAIITPNIAEFQRLLKAADIASSGDVREQARSLAERLDITVLVKGAEDVIANKDTYIVSDHEGSPRRVSGQGDTLSGCIATFLGWRKAYNDGLWDTTTVETDLLLLCGYAGSSITRKASNLAFKEKGRSMVTTDVTTHVGAAFKEIFE